MQVTNLAVAVFIILTKSGFRGEPSTHQDPNKKLGFFISMERP